MSGNIAGLASYNGTGTQGTAVVDSPEREGEIMSTIWNKNDTTRQLITGTAFKELTPGGIVSEYLNNTTTTFTIGNDVDVIGEIYVVVGIDRHDLNLDFTNILYYGLFNKIELLVGSQVWQTLTPASLVSSNNMEDFGMSYNLFTVFNHQTFGGINPYTIIPLKLGGLLMNTISPTNSNFTEQVNNGYLMAAAPNQDMHIKIYWSNAENIYNSLGSVSAGQDAVNIISCRCFCKQTTLSNFEREQVQKMVIPKRVCMTQTCSQAIALSDVEKTYTFSINCDPLNIFASALTIGFRFNDITGRTYADHKTLHKYDGTIELFLNGSSFSGPMSTSLLAFLGQNMIHSNCDPNRWSHWCVFPLANNLYGSGVPLNRFDNIRIVVKIPEIRYRFDPPLTSGPRRPSIYKNDFLDVVAIGESTILYSGGAASLNKF